MQLTVLLAIAANYFAAIARRRSAP